jgi:hypothetical protein
MIANEVVTVVASLHRQLITVLGELERVGRAVAAAHVVAAIDVLEAELDGRDALPFAHEADDGVVAMTKAMVDTFGGRAETVARQQLTEAEGLARLAWAAIVQRLAEA